MSAAAAPVGAAGVPGGVDGRGGPGAPGASGAPATRGAGDGPTGASHRVWALGPQIDTDVLAPGAYMKLGVDGIAPHCLESVRPGFAARVRRGDVIAAGADFGVGSSREQAAAVLVHLGVAAVIAPSYSGLFFRNAFNVGLLLLTAPTAGELREGTEVRLDLDRPAVVDGDGRAHPCEPVPGFLLEMARAGGLHNVLRARLAAQRARRGVPDGAHAPDRG